jgi:sporulation protein YlmC with PRC-barrel domain
LLNKFLSIDPYVTPYPHRDHTQAHTITSAVDGNPPTLAEELNMSNSPHFLSASTLTGDKVKNLKGESLGDLKDIMIDTATGSIAYGVLSFGGVMGLGEKLFAVPWEALRVDGANKELVLDVDKERLKDAPGFDKDHWPNFADTTFVNEVRRYYIH